MTRMFDVCLRSRIGYTSSRKGEWWVENRRTASLTRPLAVRPGLCALKAANQRNFHSNKLREATAAIQVSRASNLARKT